MWPYLLDVCKLWIVWVQFVWAVYVGPILKPKKPSVSSDTEED